VETIWEGDVKQLSRAYELSCIVDQIHGYAANQHRKFVIKHLEAWLQHAEKCETDRLEESLRLHPDEVPKNPPRPEWYNVKIASQNAANAKAAKTREYNRSRALQISTLDNASNLLQISQRREVSAQPHVVQLQKKRGRGRPRKQEMEQRDFRDVDADEPPIKRGRGRPRKHISILKPKGAHGRAHEEAKGSEKTREERRAHRAIQRLERRS
jgi:hypothetical protein